MQSDDLEQTIYKRCLKTLDEANKKRLQQLDALRRELERLTNPIWISRQKERGKNENSVPA
ncbi:MAG: hypothetical protein LBI57_06750 [Helicobacteraceae bacterium]|nr:hypothetical protein [Helicobacteraceae bacterium]